MTTAMLVQDDLFGGPSQSLGRVAVDQAPTQAPVKKRPRKRKVATTSIEARARAERAASTHAARVTLDVKGNGKFGRTRQELADRTNIKLQSVCGVVAKLLKDGVVFEPIIGWDGPTPIHFRRDGRTVLVATLYKDTFDWIAFGQALERERSSAA